MPYIALKTITVSGGAKRLPGDVVPEAEKWKNPKLWERHGDVRFVSDSEIQNGRWIHYEEYRGFGAIPVPPARDVSRPQSEAAPEPHVEAEVEIDEPTTPGPTDGPSAPGSDSEQELMPRRGTRRRMRR